MDAGMRKTRLPGDTRAPALVRRVAGGLRARRRAWSAEKDKAFHDDLFERQDFDPFGFHYPGYVTIRRFADLVSPFLKDVRSVLDVGCGPAEITCELARRFPEIAFHGVDHSTAGIGRAELHARTLELENATFEVAAAETFSPDGAPDMITMFDAFHHLADPGRFVRRMRERTSRFLLIEPRGDWKGSWRKDLDFDWLLFDLDEIRARVAALTGEREGAPQAPAKRLSEARQAPHGTPPQRHPLFPREVSAIENRYTLDDFRRFFAGFGLRVRGTVSGLDTYPPGSVTALSPSRERFFKLAYDLYAEIDDLLHERRLDLLAKHWIIYAAAGLSEEPLAFPTSIPAAPEPARIQGPYDLEYGIYEGPREVRAGADLRARLKIRNVGWRVWSSASADKPDYVSYHWLDARGADVVVWDGERTPLPRDIGPGEELDLLLRVKAPDRPGRFILAVDMVREGEAWYSDAGIPWRRVPFRITER
jgi:SAM-dependent methyltransferase